MRIAWITLKALLTLLLFGIAFIVGIDLYGEPKLGMLVIMAVLFVLAALLWADYSNITPKQILMFFAILGLGTIFISYDTYTGGVEFPKSCSLRSRLFCELENFLFNYGGLKLAALPTLILGIFMTWIPYGLFKKEPALLTDFIKKKGWEFLDKK